MNSSAPYYGIINTELTDTSGEVGMVVVNPHAFLKRDRAGVRVLRVAVTANGRFFVGSAATPLIH